MLEARVRRPHVAVGGVRLEDQPLHGNGGHDVKVLLGFEGAAVDPWAEKGELRDRRTTLEEMYVRLKARHRAIVSVSSPRDRIQTQ